MTSKQPERPRSTRTAIIALAITGIGVGIAGFSLFKHSADSTNSSPYTNSSAVSIGGSVTAGRDVNINTYPAAPKQQAVLIQTINPGYEHGILLPGQIEDGLDVGETMICPGAKVEVANNTASTIPLKIEEWGTDNVADLGVVKAGDSLYFNSSSEPSRYLVSRSDEKGALFFIFTIKKC